MPQFDPIDVHVGTVLRAQRRRKGMSLANLADAIGVSYQQVQKYEHGSNRISASMLYRISQTLRTPVGDFFPGHEAAPTDWSAPDRWDLSAGETLVRLESPQVRKALTRLVEALGRSAETG